MLLASRRAGYSDEELVATGLAQRSRARPGSVYDRFRERVMFPAVDARGRVHGFGARRMREETEGRPERSTSTPPTASSTTSARSCSGSTWHARAAAKAGRMILVEGYTDVLALHQAGIRNAVGIMGTSLTEEQIRELERVVKILELCLDADRAGQDAMLRASRVASGRDLELRVVPLPEGTDPADLIERDGAEALRALVQSSTPFVVFNVERILEHADTRSAEGRDRALSELRPVLNELGASVLRDDLVRRVAGRLELTEGRLATLLAGGGSAGGVLRGRPSRQRLGPRAGRRGPRRPADAGQAVRGERLFLALCLAVPDVGATILANLDVDGILTSTLLRRAARHLDRAPRRPAGRAARRRRGVRPDDQRPRRAGRPRAGPQRRPPGARPPHSRPRPPGAGHHPRPGRGRGQQRAGSPARGGP